MTEHQAQAQRRQAFTQVQGAMSEEFDPYRKWLGIAPHEQPPHHYRLLGIAPFEDDPDVIENAADRQMAHVRTYQSGRHRDHSQRILNELSAAKVLLLDPAKKTAYDAQLHELLYAPMEEPAAVEPAPVPLPAPPPPRRDAGPPPIPTGAPMPVGTLPMGSPVPPPGPAPFPVGNKSRSVASRTRAKRKSSPVPLLIGGCVIALIAVGVVVMLASQNQEGDDVAPDEQKPTVKKVAPVETPKKSLPTPKSSKGGTEPKPQPNPSQAVNVQPKPANLTPEQKFDMAIIAARTALGSRDLTKAEQAIKEAEAAKLSDDHQPRIEDLRSMYAHVERFWKAVNEAIQKRMEPGDAFMHGGEEVELVNREEDGRVTLRFSDKEQTSKITELPPVAAALFARKAMDTKDAKSHLALASFWTLDAQAAARPGAADRAKKLWTEAAERGQVDRPLAELIGLDDDYISSIKPTSDKDDEGLPKLPMLDKPDEDKSEEKSDDSKNE